DPEIGGSICSPTTVAMILLSYGIAVDPLQFARDTRDPYYGIFGVWPRVVQNASEYGVKGTVTRYRSWSEAREVLARGGRIGMSIGQPLYSGHLIMLAGFTVNGDPIVHDPARTNTGYGHIFNKSDLSHAWFDKGGVAYTIFMPDSTALGVGEPPVRPQAPATFALRQNWPNPFNAATTFEYELSREGQVEFHICDLLGRRIVTLAEGRQPAGLHQLRWEGRDQAGMSVASGIYLYQLRFEEGEVRSGRLTVLR
ncbi:MAG TPA: C39 family peptidase, partial [bacterium]|nr:C39 family peptidase [bacterium]